MQLFSYYFLLILFNHCLFKKSKYLFRKEDISLTLLRYRSSHIFLDNEIYALVLIGFNPNSSHSILYLFHSIDVLKKNKNSSINLSLISVDLELL
ncbi:hypothetical protein HOF65_01955 [bacterium]|jgi:hypothetical protein|nr:hypothetical protein [bacterium]MBT3852775.1 hypothetical protein [bacterium]MBT4633354.1 hypothetical protein [bacterium]MBT6778797.1 hypothetical protein [bacterium]